MPNRPFVYERVYLPLYKVADTPFYIQGDEIGALSYRQIHIRQSEWISLISQSFCNHFYEKFENTIF